MLVFAVLPFLCGTALSAKYCKPDGSFCAEAQLLGSDEVLFKITSSAAGWSTIGLAKNDGMHESDAMIAWRNVDGSLGLQDGHNVYTHLYVDKKQDLTGISASKDSSGNNVLQFKRKLKTGDKDDIDITPDEEQAWVFGYANNIPAPHPEHHTWVKIVKMKLVSAGSVDEVPLVTVGDYNFGKVELHGILNVIAWSVVIPLGALIARFGKRMGPVWLLLHRSCIIISALLMIASAYLILPTVSSHLSIPHHLFGMATNGLAIMLQIPLGYSINKQLSPKQATIVSNGNLHKFVALVLVSLSSLALYTGMATYGVEEVYRQIWYAYQFIVLPSVWLLLTCVSPAVKHKKPERKQ